MRRKAPARNPSDLLTLIRSKPKSLGGSCQEGIPFVAMATPAPTSPRASAQRPLDPRRGGTSVPVASRWMRLRRLFSTGTAGRSLTLGAMFVALVISLPALAVVATAFETATASLSGLGQSVMAELLTNSFLLATGTLAGVLVLGVSTAWLVTMCRFPGRDIFHWALILPLAVPAYVVAYAYTDFLHHPGPVQSLLRDITGWGANDYWFPNIRSEGGAVFVFSFVLYPYVYLLARASFLEQSVGALEASRTLGQSAWGAFWKTALPLARPAIAAGAALALMETLADFGTVAHFGVRSFTTAIYQSWFSLGDRVLAGQLSAALLGLVTLLILVERVSRSGAGYAQNSTRIQRLPDYELSHAQGLAAFVACAIPVVLGFLLPIGILIYLNWIGGHDLFGSRYVGLTVNTFTLAGIAAVLAVLLALLMAYAVRLSKSPMARLANRMAGLGYAVPGSVIAVGVLIPLANMDNMLDAWMQANFGISTGLILTGSIAGLVFAYLVRFMAVSINTVEASLAKVTPNMDAAARSLGHSKFATLLEVHAPLMRGSLLTAGLIVFVDVVKELPATLIMRPFNFDTLAIQAYRLASDERLAEASTASLMIVATGLLPVIILSRTIMASRPGAKR